MNQVILTGASGFLGRSIHSSLCNKYHIDSLGRNSRMKICCDLSEEVPFITTKYDLVVHTAGKAHSIPNSHLEIQDFYNVNFEGTKNLCLGLEKAGVPKAFIFISTVAVYGCESGDLITEEYPLNGNTPYALSKIKAEQFLEEWAKQHNVILSILRPSLIAGPNPPGNLGAMISGINSGKYLSINGGKAKKSIVMAQDIANLIPLLIEKGGVYNVCDSSNPSFHDLELLISKQLGKAKPFNLPLWLAKAFGVLGDCMGKYAPINSSKVNKITSSLTFSNEKIKKELNWEPLDVLSNFKIV